eukprot:scaffold188525_cov37-Tisochrysis_lutea.AAC.2
MPTFLAVRCFACGTFQSIQRTKQSKWACKLCHEKQSFQRAYAMSDAAKDVRYAVQELNYMRGEAEQQLQAFEREWQGNAGHCLQGQNCAHSVDLGERWEVLDEANSQHCLRQEREVHDDQHFPANISAKAQEAQQDAHASTRFQSTSVRGNLNGIERPLSRWAKYTPLSHHPIDDNIGVASLYEPTEARMWHNPDQFGMPVSFSSADDGGHEIMSVAARNVGELMCKEELAKALHTETRDFTNLQSTGNSFGSCDATSEMDGGGWERILSEDDAG